ncbi:hypothetical protein [Mesorhizobium sp.]|uniref:hypothetical protein n=1 Tax=Mesorhizobium sp. TaxID=1871066 RepID=UPI0025BA48CE|nr:hypothetical protein [Mesorhizobium sp.]
MQPISRDSLLSISYGPFALRHLSPASASVPQLRLRKDGKIGHRKHQDPVEGQSNAGTERIQAELGSRLSFREAARVLVCARSAPHNHRTVVNRLAKVADQIEKRDVASPYRISRADGSPISVFIDGAYIRAVPGYQSRHFEITMGRVVAKGRPSRQFAAAPNVATGKHAAVRAALRAQGWLPGRDVTVFSDGDAGLQVLCSAQPGSP